MCRLVSRLKCPEFIDLIHEYEIIGIQESKTDDTDQIDIPSYTVFSHNRASISRFRSGGITLIIKDELLPFIKVDQTRNSKLILLFNISRHLFNLEEDVKCGVVYVPPYGSKYMAEDPYLEIQSELLRYSADSKYMLLFGDFNSRTGTLPDYLKFDENICEMNYLNCLHNENSEMFSYLDLHNISTARKSADNNVNTYGRHLIELCKNNNLFIMNGRIGYDKNQPKVTCKDKSTVDYFLSSVYCFGFVHYFRIHEHSELYSDVHCPLSLTLSVDCQTKSKQNENEKPLFSETNVRNWDSRKAEKYLENFDILSVAEIETSLDQLSSNGHISIDNVNDIVTCIGNLFKTCSKDTFGEKKTVFPKFKDKIKPWFNLDCRNARNLYHRCRRMYNNHKTNYYKNILKIVSKKYKRTLTKIYRKYKENKASELRRLESTDPRKYWKIINSDNNKNNIQASVDDLYDFFKTTNAGDPSANTSDIPQDTSNIQNTENEEINQPIIEDEILLAVKSLKNNKSPGTDDVVNEQIKSTITYMMPIYIKLFNIVLDTGIIPENWSMGTIKPIFKNKGDPKLPENYRPIIILSCFGKLFTSIINNRLNKFADNHNIITSSQAGFRKQHSTTDNIFIIKSLIDIVRSGKKKLYCCFVDFKQAFDTVWRDGLWSKLVQYRINGKCFKVIHNFYKDIKSKVMTKEGTSNYFSCNVGVRQGENLSPFLFSIFLNDLETHLQ